MRGAKIFVGVLLIVFGLGFAAISLRYYQSQHSPTIISAVVSDTYVDTSNRESLSEKAPPGISQTLKNPVNILFLGLDNRRGQKSSRCDAVHLLSYDIQEEQLVITNIPRGTPYPIAGFEDNFSIISNACSTLGIDAVIVGIEKMTNTPIDYVAKTGFSEVMGIARALKLPATETLMSLRSRAYGVGDNQRSYNQAVFIKDNLIKHLQEYPSFPKPFRSLIFGFLDTTLDFETADSLLLSMSKSKIATDESRITIHTFSPFNVSVKDIHLLTNLETTQTNPTDKEYIAYQQGTIAYLQNLIKTSSRLVKDGRKDQSLKTIELPFSQKIWLQVDDETTRNTLHFQLLSLFAQSSLDTSQTDKAITDYEKETGTVFTPTP